MKILNKGNWVSRYLQQAPLEKFNVHLQCIYQRYYWEDTNTFDYIEFQQSKDFKQHSLITRALTTLDLDRITEPSERLAFWLNLYNALCIHIIASERLTGKISNHKNVFSGYAYEIGGMTFTLDDIEHCILRCNSKPYGSLRRQFGDQDERRRLILIGQEPRIHFAMYSACSSSPQLQHFSPENLEGQLSKNTKNYLSNEVTFEPDKKKIVIPKLFQWYNDDFGNPTDIIGFIKRYSANASFQTWLKQNDSNDLSINYQAFNWEINQSGLIHFLAAET